MSDLLSYLYTVLTRIWDIISYPFELVGKVISFLESGWGYISSIQSLFPAWISGFILLCFVLGVVLLILKR